MKKTQKTSSQHSKAKEWANKHKDEIEPIVIGVDNKGRDRGGNTRASRICSMYLLSHQVCTMHVPPYYFKDSLKHIHMQLLPDYTISPGALHFCARMNAKCCRWRHHFTEEHFCLNFPESLCLAKGVRFDRSSKSELDDNYINYSLGFFKPRKNRRIFMDIFDAITGVKHSTFVIELMTFETRCVAYSDGGNVCKCELMYAYTNDLFVYFLLIGAAHPIW